MAVVCLVLVLICTYVCQNSALRLEPKERRHLESPLFHDCPKGFSRFGNSCFHVAHDLANWPEAVVYCQVYGSHLAFIESEAESQFVTAYLKNFSASATDKDHYYWIGGTDAVSEGSWYWINVVKPITYTNWGPGEPDNSPAMSSHHQDCLAIFESSGKWDDGWCETRHNFLCEIDLDVEEIVG
ncbi:perlucin-like [Ruditapes philippinarum]|uniref:perlucin-like n=1 Tax=Ruditapes philippinarum TaxID=129788 RepID=UPI00295B43B4|nr:perlucin-like [Ruditapes philippinarum]